MISKGGLREAEPPLLKFWIVLVDLAPQKSALDLLFTVHYPNINSFVFNRYDESPYCHMTIEIFLDVSYFISKLD